MLLPRLPIPCLLPQQHLGWETALLKPPRSPHPVLICPEQGPFLSPSVSLCWRRWPRKDVTVG